MARFSKAFALLTVVASMMVLPNIGKAQVPANDECSGAFAVASLPYSLNQNTRLATANPSDPVLTCADGGGGKTVWFTYIPDSTRYVRISTLGSTPADYDIALAVFTGACGSLVQVECNDDAGGTRQSEIIMQVNAGVTYIIHVAEWNGGGPSGGVPTGGDLVFTVTASAPPPPTPLVRGPKNGSVPSGATISTNGFPLAPAAVEQGRKDVPLRPVDPPRLPPKNVMSPKGPEGSNYVEDRGAGSLTTTAVRPIVIQSFQGIPQTQYQPPDPAIAVGPNHVLACVNSTFRIWDKNGTVLKTISLSSWFSNVRPGISFSDPRVVYDQFANRWVMIGIDANQTTTPILVSVSDDDNPLGTWYNWALPGELLGDSATANFSDHPKLGFDDQALYISSREFAGTRQYSKLRVVAKAQLYANTAGPVTWADFWDFKNPDDFSVAPDFLEPAITFGHPGVEFLVFSSPYSTGTFFTLWKLRNPLASTTITGSNVPVVAYTSPTSAPAQLGGATAFGGGGTALWPAVVYRDSSLWAVHSVANPANPANAAVHYMRFNPFANSNMEDAVVGQQGYWHFYPEIMPDAHKNIVITYSRSSASEYIGAFVAGRKNTDPPGLSSSVTLKGGDAYYGGSRWGDYMGIALDPIDTNAVWAFTQYAASPANNWGTWVGRVKFDVPGAYVNVEPSSYAFRTTEVGFRGDTTGVTIYNGGADTLVVTNLTFGTPHFIVLNAPALPLRVAPTASAILSVNFVPQATGNFIDSLTIVSNAANFPIAKVRLTATGFAVRQAVARTMYVTSGSLLTVNPNTGATTNLGASGYTSVLSARVNPATKELFGLSASGSNTLMLRINSLAGDAHSIGSIPLNNLKGMAFRGDTLYVGRITGAIYRVNISTGVATLVATTSPLINISGLAFHPVTGQLYASVRAPSTTPDAIYKVSLPSAATTLVGTTGQGPTQDIIFSNAGQLFGVTNTGSTTNNLIRIDTSTGIGTLVGSMGIIGAQGLATRPDSSFVTGIEERELGTVPVTYSLEQNYPNPFNPTTQIRFGVPQQSHVTLTIYDVLGQEVARLVDGIQSTGFHEITWNGSKTSGGNVSSGIYFYKLAAGSFVETRKMLLLK